jgi:hypothetical protein
MVPLRLERRHFAQQPEIRRERDLPAIEIQQMVQGKEDAGLPQGSCDVERISAQRLDGRVDRFGHPVDAEMDLDLGIRIAARHLLRHEEVIRVGMTIEKLEAPLDAVVIGDRHQVHPPGLCDAVHRFGRRVAVPALEEAHAPASQGMA